MSLPSSPEERPFLTKPSPLSDRYHPVERDFLGDFPSAPPPEIRVVEPVKGDSQSFRTRASSTVDKRNRWGSNKHSRRRHNKPTEPHGTRRNDRDSAPTRTHSRHDDLSQLFGPTSVGELIDVSSLESTFNPEAFSKDRAQADTQLTAAVENILDEPPNPFDSTHRVPNKSSHGGRWKGQSGWGSGSRKPGKSSIEKELGITIEVNQPIAKTFVRPELPLDLLDWPTIFHPRVSMSLSVTQPLYIGGGCVAGRFNIHIRGTRLDDIRLGRVSIDIAGVEELSFSRKAMFMSVASELIDEDHPPPSSMLAPADEDLKTFWKVKPSRSFLPFRINLPLNVGPGPFHSVRAKVRYVIHGTIMVSINGHKSIIRCCRDIRIISALDPETALLPLDTPLSATDEHSLRFGGQKTVKVTAGLHRAVWVSGTAAYVDVNIINNTSRRIKCIRCKLRRHILAYKNTIALSENKSAGHLRVPNWIERKTLSHSELNIGKRWRGVKGSQIDVLTCEVEIPRNQLSVKLGRYFEVKYVVDIAVCTFAARTIRVQLPLTVVHMNSLDIIPNDLADVAATIEDLYGSAAKGYIAGRAFRTPRENSTGLDRQRAISRSSTDKAANTRRRRTKNAGVSRDKGKEKADIHEEHIPTVRVIKTMNPNAEKLELDSFSFLPDDPHGATPQEQQRIWEDHEKLFKLARRRSSQGSIARRGS